MSKLFLFLLLSVPPISLESSSIGCLRAVISLNVQRNRTTISLSFFMGEMCSNSHRGVPAIRQLVVNNTARDYLTRHYFRQSLKDRKPSIAFAQGLIVKTKKKHKFISTVFYLQKTRLKVLRV